MRTSTLLKGLAVGAAIHLMRRRPYLHLGGATAVITGGSRGLGLLLARELCGEGAHVVLLARSAIDLERARVELSAAGGDVSTAVCDVGDRGAVNRVMERVLARRGRIDLLINNAGAIQVGPLDHMHLEDFERAMRVHLWGPLHTTLAVLPAMRRQGGGHIVNISSVGGRVAVPHLAPYSASKFALTGLSSALRSELAREDIHVTTVCPGLMRTGSHINAEVKGRHGDELTWFAVAASAPVLAMDGQRAARRIIAAARRGRAHLDLGATARLVALANGVAPSLLAGALTLVNRLLPSATGARGDVSRFGREVRSRWAPSILTRLGDQASVRNHEVTAHPQPQR